MICIRFLFGFLFAAGKAIFVALTHIHTYCNIIRFIICLSTPKLRWDFGSVSSVGRFGALEKIFHCALIKYIFYIVERFRGLLWVAIFTLVAVFMPTNKVFGDKCFAWNGKRWNDVSKSPILGEIVSLNGQDEKCRLSQAIVR